MDITIQRNVEKQYSLELAYWKRKTIKLRMGLPIIFVIATIGILKNCLSHSASDDHSYFSIIFNTVASTFALTSIWIVHVNKSNTLKASKDKVTKNLSFPTTIKITETGISLMNPELTTTYNWEYFKNYYIKENTLYIIKNKITPSIIISLEELTQTEKSKLPVFLNGKGIKQILF